MKQLFEQTALLLVVFVPTMALGWLAADVSHRLFAVVLNILASA